MPTQITQLPNFPIYSGFLQLGILLHQLLQAEAWKLYRNLGFFAFSLALVDRSFAVFRMTYSLPRTESALTGRRFHRRRFRDAELLAAAGEELGNVLDGVVGARRDSWLRTATTAATRIVPRRTLIFVFIRIVRAFAVVRRRTSSRGPPRLRSRQAIPGTGPCDSQLFNQPT